MLRVKTVAERRGLRKEELLQSQLQLSEDAVDLQMWLEHGDVASCGFLTGWICG